ncbi:MAG TPA: four helix bundle protein [Thermoanaerobaculia bacterium]
MRKASVSEVKEAVSETLDIYERTFRFACRVLKMDRALAKDRRVNRQAMHQLVAASSSIGANMEEARAGQSKADFHAKLRIALKEARESHYWLRLLLCSDSIKPERIEPLLQEANEIVAILTTIAKKTNPRNPAE